MLMREILLVLLAVAASPVAIGMPVLPFEMDSQERGLVPPLSAALDNLVSVKQKAAGIPRARMCSDEVFLRRVFLDVIGTLPTQEEAVEFLADKNPEKRRALIDRLLERPEFADYWGMKWADILRVKSEFPVNLWPNAAQAYDGWIRTSIRQNMPYSQFAHQLLTAEGSNFRDPPVNFLRSAGSREPEALAAAAALVFMGERTANWPPEKRADLAVFFSRVGFKKTGEWKEEIVFFNPPQGGDSAPVSARLPDGTRIKIKPETDPREVFSQWLLSSANSPFARNAANRIWFWIFGRGIVHEPDDSRPDNPPSNPQLLAWLARQLQAAKYDTKQFLRIILNSDTYQLSPIPPDDKVRSAGELASYPVRRLEAEVLMDAINRITGAKEEYMSMIPEPFTYLPDDMRSIALPDGSITSSLLELFGRPPRDTGLLVERAVNVTASQRLSLLNSKHMLSKINSSRKLKDLLQSAPNEGEALSRLYLTFLSRYPTQDELAVAAAYKPPANTGKNQKLSDITWALMNSPEFLYRH